MDEPGPNSNLAVKDAINSFRIYPNPASDRLSVDPGERIPEKDARIRIYSVSGILVHEIETRERVDIDLSSGVFGSGVYILEIKTESAVESHRLIISK